MLRNRKAEVVSEIDFHIERASGCIRKCQENLEELNEYLNVLICLVVEESAKFHDTVITALSRAQDFAKYWRNNIQGDLAELNLMEKLIDVKIDSRYTGKTTAVDLFAKFNEKIVLIQVKSTRDNNRVIAKEEIRYLLKDSLYFSKYPIIDMAFFNDNTFEHFFIPIEEIMSKLSQKSVSISRNRLGRFHNLDFDTFKRRMRRCSFPIMKFDQTQFESWIQSLES